MIQAPDFLNYPEWYEENKELANEIGNSEQRYSIKENAPEFIKKSYREYLEMIHKIEEVSDKIIDY